MSRSAYPVTAEVEEFLTLAGVTVPDDYTFDNDILGAVEWWEDATGWNPFLAESSPSTLYFLAPNFGSRLMLGTAFYTVTDVSIGLDINRANGTSLVVNEEYVPVYWKPNTEEGWIWGIDFSTFFSSSGRTISVTGRRGCQASLDESVYQAILQRTALIAYGKLTGARGKVSRIKQGPHEQEFNYRGAYPDVGLLGSIVEGWDVFCRETVSLYTRMIL